MNQKIQDTIDALDFQAYRLEREAEAKKDIIVTSPASKLSKRRASQAAREARSLRRKIQKLVLKLNP